MRMWSNVLVMDTSTSNPTTGERVAAAIASEDRAEAWVADQIGMSPTAFRRRIRSGGGFTPDELARIARVLHARPIDLLPDEFHADNPAADEAA